MNTQRTAQPVMRLEGRVSIDGGIVYVNGMELAGILRSFCPPATAGAYDRLTITIEVERNGPWVPGRDF